jgi:AraC-like DNA-binding protein
VIPSASGHYHELATDRRGEKLWVHRSEAIAGIEIMKVQDSDRRWEVVHDAFAICLVNGPHSMQAEWRYRRKLHQIGVGEMQLMEPGEIHCTTDVSEPASFFVVRWHARTLREAAIEFEASPEVHFRSSQVAVPVLRSALDALDGSLAVSSSEFELQCGIANSTYELITNCADSKPRLRRAGALHPGLRRARARLDQQFIEKVGLDELAKEAGMAKFHFAHAFADAYGVSPYHYLMMRRVEAARGLLQSGSSIAETSAMTGFADQAHLTRNFRKILGYTPGAWVLATRGRVLRSIPLPKPGVQITEKPTHT